MFGHFLTSAWTHYVRTPFTTLINLIALALGMACFLAAWGISSYWGLTDQEFANAERTVIITQQFVVDGQEPRPTPTSARPAAKYIALDVPILEAVGQLGFAADKTIISGARSLNMRGAEADPAILEIFDFEFVSGDPSSALAAQNGLILTEAAARRLFETANPMGKPIRIGTDREATVTGVIKAPRQPSHLGQGPGTRPGFDFLYRWEVAEEGAYEHWVGVTGLTYALLPEGDVPAARKALTDQLRPLGKRRIPENQMSLVGDIWFGAMPMSEIQARTLDDQLFRGVSQVFNVTNILFGLGLLVLVVSCINYANLATAQAVGYAKEVGLRKVVGAGRSSILIQYWLEALILAVAAGVVAFGLLAFLSPIMQATAGFDLLAGLFAQANLIVTIVLLVIGVSVAASIYPCIYLGNIRPVEALRSGKVRGGSRNLTEVLVGVQFAAASALLIMVLVVGQQNRFMQTLALVPDTDPVVILTDAASQSIGPEVLGTALAGQPGIQATSQVNFEPWSGYVNYVEYAGSRDEAVPTLTGQISYVGFGFFETFESKLLTGRVYTPERDGVTETESEEAVEERASALVIDQVMVAELGFASPEAAIGEHVYLSRTMARAFNNDPEWVIVGVVETVPLVLASGGARANMYVLDTRTGHNPLVRIDRTDVRQGLATIERVVKSRAPDAAIMARFLDDEFERSFRTYQGINQGFQGLSLIAFAISAMGLFAMAMFTAMRRRHEIGVRKTMGASAIEIMILLLKDFSRPVIIANLLAWPIAYFAARAYLGGFMQRTALTPWPWLLALIITLGIAWVSVGGQAWRAARVNPAEVLKDE